MYPAHTVRPNLDAASGSRILPHTDRPGRPGPNYDVVILNGDHPRVVSGYAWQRSAPSVTNQTNHVAHRLNGRLRTAADLPPSSEKAFYCIEHCPVCGSNYVE